MFESIIINILISIIPLFIGFVVGRIRERRLQMGTPIEETDYYPFVTDENNMLEFDLDLFIRAMNHFLSHRNDLAGGQLIILATQNNVKNLLKAKEKQSYKKLFKKYKGDQLLDDTISYLENYKRIVRLIGESFPDAGIEILLHNLSNPAKALYVLKNNVTGREIEAPATNLVIDLKRRSLRKQDKLNYELNIGSRKFKCTTIPIYRGDYGLVGCICINVDYHYLNEEVRNNDETRNTFLNSILRTDMVLNENILSKEEFHKANLGKRHYRDFSV